MERPAKRPRLAKDASDHVAEPIEAMQQYRDSGQRSISFAGYGLQNTGNFKAGRDFIINVNEQSNINVKAGERKRLLELLQFDQMDARQLTIKKAHAQTCAWFLDTPPYVNWKTALHNDQNFLWIKGKPGTGKSTLMKFLLGKLRDQIRQAGNQEILLSFFFNARGDDLEKTTAGLYRTLLLQLLEARPKLQYVLDDIRIGHSWTIGPLKTAFEKAIQGLGNSSIVCLVDALDECDEEEIRDMVSFLRDMSVISKRSRICFASRHYPHITMKTAESIILEKQAGHFEDIITYIHSALTIEDDSLADEIRRDLQKKASGVFMWVVLVVDMLNRQYDAGYRHCLRERIRQLPGDLHKLFLDILTRDNNNMDGLLLCIQWVIFSREPLTPRQFYLALVSGLEPQNLPVCHSDDISKDSIEKYILSNSKGLAEATKSTIPTIQFIHESVRNFLLEENGLSRIWPDISKNVYGLSHNMLKECCHTYMNMPEATTLEGSRTERMAAFPFLSYANQGILYHANEAQRYNTRQQDFITKFPLSRWVKHHNYICRFFDRYTPKVSLLYILAEFDMGALIRSDMNRQSCFKIEDERYGNPILAASARRNTEAIQIMLEVETERLSETSLSHLSSLIMMPGEIISYASRNRHRFNKHEDLFCQLIEHGNEKASLFFLAVERCDVNIRNLQGETVLMSAVKEGFGVLVRELLQRGADVLAADKDGRTALHLALIRRSDEIAKLLIDRGSDIFAADKDGRTALHLTSTYGYNEISAMFINDIFSHSTNGRATLHLALTHSSDKIAKLLIGDQTDALATYNDELTASDTVLLNDSAEISRLLTSRATLHMALVSNNVDVSRLHISRGASLLFPNGYNYSLLPNFDQNAMDIIDGISKY